MAIKRKTKKKIVRKRAKSKITRKITKIAKKILKQEALGVQETIIEKTKYSVPEPAKVSTPVIPQDLPGGYGKDKIILQVRDPWWIYAYWEVTPFTWNKLRERLKEAFFSAKKILRVYDISHIIFDGRNAHRFFDIEVTLEANNWYIDTAGPGRSWCVDLGLRLPNGEFIRIARSNTVNTPLDGPSWITDEEWMIPEDMFARLYGMGFGLGRSSPVGRAWQERVKRELFSGVLASPGITSVSKSSKPRKSS